MSAREEVPTPTYPVLKEAAMRIGGGGAGPISVASLEHTMQMQVVCTIQ